MQSAQPTPVDVFLRTHPDRGGLRVQVTCGGGRFPVAGAQVVISRAFGTEEHIFYRGVTDGSGILSGIRLPAPPFAWSQASDTAAISGQPPGRSWPSSSRPSQAAIKACKRGKPRSRVRMG